MSRNQVFVLFSVFNWTFLLARYGYGAENILSMRVVLADGRIAEVTAEKTEVRKTTYLKENVTHDTSPDSFSLTEHSQPHGRQ